MHDASPSNGAASPPDDIVSLIGILLGHASAFKSTALRPTNFSLPCSVQASPRSPCNDRYQVSTVTFLCVNMSSSCDRVIRICHNQVASSSSVSQNAYTAIGLACKSYQRSHLRPCNSISFAPCDGEGVERGWERDRTTPAPSEGLPHSK